MPVKAAQPWDRKPNESLACYDLFLRYLGMGSDRNVEDIVKETGRRPALIQSIKAHFCWSSRCWAHDKHIGEARKRAAERTAEEEAVLRERKRAEYRNKEFAMAERLLARAGEMLDFPLTETIENKLEMINGELVAVAVTVKPVRWSLRDALAFADTASKLMRLSLEMETARNTLNVNFSDDPNARLLTAKSVLRKMVNDVESLVQQMLDKDATLDKDVTREQILEQLPAWVAEDWKVEVDVLREEYIQHLMSLPAAPGETEHIN